MAHPIRLSLDEDLSRNRLTVLVRVILAIPHLIWLAIWGIAAAIAIVVNWIVTLVAGTSPDGLHEFLARYLRYQTHVVSYLLFLADPYPPFMGEEGSYPTDLHVDGPVRQNRWITGFRLILAIPAQIVAAVLGYLTYYILAVVAWIVCLVLGRIPKGFRDLLAWIVRFNAQTNGYVYILTDRYPSFSPDPHE